MLSSEIAKIVIFEVNLDPPAPVSPSINMDIFFLSMLFCQGVFCSVMLYFILSYHTVFDYVAILPVLATLFMFWIVIILSYHICIVLLISPIFPISPIHPLYPIYPIYRIDPIILPIICICI